VGWKAEVICRMDEGDLEMTAANGYAATLSMMPTLKSRKLAEKMRLKPECIRNAFWIGGCCLVRATEVDD
jgi:hypothetical protein